MSDSIDLKSHRCIVMIDREVADHPGVGVVLVVGYNLSHGGQIQHVPLRRGPHPLRQSRFSRGLEESVHCVLHTPVFICTVLPCVFDR